YLAGTVLAATFVWGALRVAREPRRLAAWVGLDVAIAVAFLPQLPTFLAQLVVNHVSHWVPKPHPRDLLDLQRHASFGSLALALARDGRCARAGRPRRARARDHAAARGAGGAGAGAGAHRRRDPPGRSGVLPRDPQPAVPAPVRAAVERGARAARRSAPVFR